MRQYTCPECHAELDSTMIEDAGGAKCFYCGADISTENLLTPAETDSPGRQEETFDAPAGGTITRPLPELPSKSRIRVVESSDARLVLFIPGGGNRAGGIGCFALVWNGFMCFFTVAIVFGPGRAAGNQPPPQVLLYLVPTVFWLVGLGMAWAWLRMRFERTFLLLDRERLVVQKVLFGRERLYETSLTRDSRAELVQSYQQNNVPVYRIEVSGTNRPAKFGTALSDPEKDWVVDRVNDFLGVPPLGAGLDDDGLPKTTARQTFPETCERCAAPLSGHAVDGVLTCAQCGASHQGQAAAVADDSREMDHSGRDEPDTPADESLEVVELTPDRLHLVLTRNPRSGGAFVMTLLIPFLGATWIGGMAYFIWNIINGPGGQGMLVPLFFMVPLGTFGFVVAMLILYAYHGHTDIELTRERLTCRWRAGLLRFTRSLPTDSIESVRVADFSQSQNTAQRRIRGQAPPRTPSAGTYTCIVYGRKKKIPLTLLHTNACSQKVAAFVRNKLTEWGQLPHHD